MWMNELKIAQKKERNYSMKVIHKMSAMFQLFLVYYIVIFMMVKEKTPGVFLFCFFDCNTFLCFSSVIYIYTDLKL